MDQYTTALLNALLQKLGEEFSDNCVLMVFSGPVPATAYAATGSATHLITYSDAGTGDPLRFDSPANAMMAKDPLQTWSGDALASGSGTFFRIVQLGDDGESAVDPDVVLRYQGTIGVVNSTWNTNKTYTMGNPDSIDQFFWVI
ncbi:MAG: hypothetical protein RBR77_04200 [Thauera sp.]|jgi:hypothetical protein|nr:hypothetical protein [Thauera sp.]